MSDAFELTEVGCSRSEVAKVAELLTAASGKTYEATELELLHTALADVSPEAAARAAERLALTERGRIPVPEVRRQVARDEGLLSPTAGIAVRQAQEWLDIWGEGGDWVWKVPWVHPAVLRLIGLAHLRLSYDPADSTTHAQVRNLYVPIAEHYDRELLYPGALGEAIRTREVEKADVISRREEFAILKDLIVKAEGAVEPGSTWHRRMILAEGVRRREVYRDWIASLDPWEARDWPAPPSPSRLPAFPEPRSD